MEIKENSLRLNELSSKKQWVKPELIEIDSEDVNNGAPNIPAKPFEGGNAHGYHS